jgi:hypothetical protein
MYFAIIKSFLAVNIQLIHRKFAVNKQFIRRILKKLKCSKEDFGHLKFVNVELQIKIN